MENSYYIVAIELSSSKISGAVGIETTNGIRILATASTPVDGFISKGIVRNVDKTSEAITRIINMLEDSLRDITIRKAYISFAGLSVHSIKSKVSRGFGEYMKITPDIIDGMETENRDTFQAPEGYKRLQMETQEYKLDGNIDLNPIGAHTQFIEGNYFNILMKEQFYIQLRESFAEAGIEIAGCSSAARFDADILLSNDLRRNGCALVNIGAETTTISIYENNFPKMIIVLPLGSNNITRDLTAERISFDKSEEIKITRGYKSSVSEDDTISNETINNVIYARMSEILQNVRYQIEETSDKVRHIIFTGGGSKLKNLTLLLEEFLPNFTTEIKPEPQFNLISESEVNVNGVITTALYALLKQGKENCCEEINKMPANEPGEIFSNNDMLGTTSDEEDNERLIAERREREEEEKKRREEERKRKEEEKKRREEEKKRKHEERGRVRIGTLFMDWFSNAMSDPDDENKEDDNDKVQTKENNNDEQ